jgi:hypothetical protein
MVDELVARLLPAILFGAIAGGVLWLLGLIRKRAALTAAILLALCFLAGRWNTTLAAAGQLAIIALSGWLLAFRTRLRVRDILSVLGPATFCAAAAWALTTAPAYWEAAFGGALVAGAAAWVGRAATDRFDGGAVQLLSLRPAATGGLNGPGAVAAAAAGVAVLVPIVGMGFLGPGEPGLALVGAFVAMAVADYLRPDRAGVILTASAGGALATLALVAGLP